MIARLLHIANSAPHRSKMRRDRFYAMKSRILHRFGTADGIDKQYILGKVCYGCGGSDEEYCDRCDSSGWWNPPRIVTLRRWRLGKFIFHEPIDCEYRKPLSHEVFVIYGFVQHESYPLRSVRRSTLILGLLFDWRVARDEIASPDGWRIVRAFRRRCQYCNRRLWTTRRWYCKRPCMPRAVQQLVDDDIPF